MEPIFVAADDPRWKLLEVARDRLLAAKSRGEVIEIAAVETLAGHVSQAMTRVQQAA